MRGDRKTARQTPSLDLDGFALTDAEVAALAETNGRSRSSRREGQPFLRGPVPLSWLDRAARLPGKALALGLALWYKHGLTRKWTVTLCQEHAGFGVDVQAARRAIAALEGARLVSVVRKPGRGLEVTILGPPDRPRQ